MACAVSFCVQILIALTPQMLRRCSIDPIKKNAKSTSNFAIKMKFMIHSIQIKDTHTLEDVCMTLSDESTNDFRF